MDRGHVLFCGAICLEVAACFAFPLVLLLYGMFLLPLFLVGVIRNGPGVSAFWTLVAMTVLGAGGMFGVVRVLILLCRRRNDPRRWLTFAALASGLAASLVYASGLGAGSARPSFTLLLLIVYLPVACTLHLVYLARRALFA
jgi:hypothetical protein